MAEFHSRDQGGSALYRYLIGCVVPRPIAWVSSRSPEGVANLSPFSFFNAVTYNPPTLAFSVMDRGPHLKDTARNIAAHPEYVVHIVSESLAGQANSTSGDFGPHVSEFGEAGLTAVPGTVVDVPRVAEALVAMECRLTHHLRFGGKEGPGTSHIIGEVVYWHVDDRLLRPDERDLIDADALEAVGRMGGMAFTRTRDRFTLERPVIPPDDPRSVTAYRARTGKTSS